MYTNCHTYYSLRYGTFSEVELLEMAQKNDITYVALTDINSTTAVLSFLQLSGNYKIYPIIGVDFRNGVDQQYVVLAKNNIGFQTINTFLSEHLHSKSDFPEKAPELENTFVIYPFEKVLELEKIKFKANEFIGISVKDLNKLPFSVYKGYVDKLVIHQTVTFRNQSDYNAHRLLRAIDLNIVLSKLPESQQGNKTDRMHTKDDLLTRYADYPSMIENTKRILQQCKVDFFFNDDRTNQNQDRYFNTKEQDFDYLKKLCYDKLYSRYPEAQPTIIERVEKELEAIKTMDFVSYFLINYDIVQYAISKEYPFIGRGSGANSIVAYIIGITNVDPIDLDLYFERFINIYRSSPPDFDIDFSWKDRNDVTRYIFERFEHTALMGTYVTFQYKAVVRELAKVFGVPKIEVDTFLKGYTIDPKNDEFFKLIHKYGKLIHGFPNYISIHSGGIIITKKPIYYYTATILPPKGFQTIMFDMNIAENLGIYKFDILAQRGLSKIKDAITIIRENQPEASIENIDNVYKFKSDPEINNLLKVGDCMGVFYVESPAMRTLMTKLQTQDYLGLVAASSIIRPGVANGGMKNQYILRHRYPEKKKEAHPVLLAILEDTYGVMVYQEDVLKVAHKFAGLSLAESDILRRGISGKSRSKGEVLRIAQKFKTNCIQKGYTPEDTESVWNQIQAFAGYAFAKGHSASYAVESYQSLYLKKYFPLEFMTAVLNNGGGFYNIPTYINEIKKCGGIVAPPCINTSDHPNRIIGKTVFLGFGMIRDIETRTIQKILNERQLYGSFTSFSEFVDRIHISLEQLILLIRLDAFRFTTIDKHHLMWEAYLQCKSSKTTQIHPVLFKPKKIDYTLPEISSNFVIDAYDQIELLGFPLVSQFQLLLEEPSSMLKANTLKNFSAKKVIIYGNLITAKRVKTNKNQMMIFGTLLDSEGDIFDVVLFPKVALEYPMKSKGIYKILGSVIEELGYFYIVADKAERQAIVPDPRFHTPENSNKNICS